jgi:hypothetical protein
MDQIEELARQHRTGKQPTLAEMVRFGRAVQAKERARAAELCRDIYRWRGAYSAGPMCSRTTETCAKAIESGV